MQALQTRWFLVAVAFSATVISACASSATAARPAPFPGSAARPAPAGAIPVAPADSEALVAFALDLRGTPYRAGGQTPDAGFDCSGFVSYVLGRHAIEVPRTAAEQYRAGRPVDRNDLRAGDLVFFSTTGPGPTHVGIVVSGAAPAEFVHAPADGSAVRLERFDTPYWQRRWVGARRLL